MSTAQPSISIEGHSYVLTFAEEFDHSPAYYQGHNTGGVWSTSYAPHLHDARWADNNGEQQYFIDPDMGALPQPFEVADGVMTITAATLTPAQQALAQGQPYGSGLLTTELSFAASTGYIEIRADVPDVAGFLSAFFLLPSDGDWSAEIDVFEILGDSPDTLHSNYWVDGESHAQSANIEGLGEGFHTFGLKWTEDTLEWYVDGTLVRSAPNEIDEPMYLAAALIVGSDWTGDPAQNADFEQGLVIDYIHVYELESDPQRNPAITQQSDFVPLAYGNGAADGALYGTRWDDLIAGEAGDDVLHGRAGSDQLLGGTGQDVLYGGDGADQLQGAADRDKLIGGVGSDTLNGGGGTDHLWGGDYGSDSAADTFVFAPLDGKDFVHGFGSEQDLIDLSAYGTSWDAVESVIIDHGWATEIRLAELSGDSGDRVYLLGVAADTLDAANFELGLIA